MYIQGQIHRGQLRTLSVDIYKLFHWRKTIFFSSQLSLLSLLTYYVARWFWVCPAIQVWCDLPCLSTLTRRYTCVRSERKISRLLFELGYLIDRYAQVRQLSSQVFTRDLVPNASHIPISAYTHIARSSLDEKRREESVRAGKNRSHCIRIDEKPMINIAKAWEKGAMVWRCNGALK